MGRAPFNEYLLTDNEDDGQRSLRRHRIFSGLLKAVKRKPKEHSYTVVDLFCGCGGLSYGLQSTRRFRTVLAVDTSEDALKTFAHNHAHDKNPPKTIQADIGKLDPLKIRSELRRFGILTGELDCLVGGPPCEGFSQNHGKAMAGRGAHDFLATGARATRQWYRGRNGRVSARNVKPIRRLERKDQRNNLFRGMLAVAAVVKPKVVLIENVREFLAYKNGAIKNEITKFFEKCGYVVEIRILNAADYGVPQMRKRAFIVAVRKDIARSFSHALFPLPTHREARAGERTVGLPGDLGLYVTVKEAIGDLPPAVHADRRPVAVNGSNTQATSAFRSYVRGRAQTLSPSHHVIRQVSPRVLKRIRAIKPGMKIHHLPAKLRTKKFYANAYARLEWHKPANTITKSFNNLGSGKFCHPSKHRGITVREAARLQSFPDRFEFIGSKQRSIGDMIGGAVPPLLAHAFGLHFARILDEARKKQRNGTRGGH